MMQISKIQIAECSIPLPYVLRLGPIEIRTRDYVVLQVEGEDGVFGEAIGYPRGTPLFETLSGMARRILGADLSTSGCELNQVASLGTVCRSESTIAT